MIIVFGSINIDLVLRVAQAPGPGETVLTPGYDAVAGGKGANQALAARRAGADVALFGAVGTDGFATPALADLSAAGVDLDGVARMAAPTGLAAVMVEASGENRIVVASGANRLAREAAVPDRLLGRDTILVTQLEVDPAETFALLRRARARGARTILNAAPAAPLPREILGDLEILVVNGPEATGLAGSMGHPHPTPEAAAQALGRLAHGLVVVVTLGGEGALAFAADAVWRVAALPIVPVDTTGAGDAFVGVLAASLSRGEDLPASLHGAAVAGALACETAGAQPSLPGAEAIAARRAALAAPRVERSLD